MPKVADTNAIRIRVPHGLQRRLAKAAQSAGRSLNAEVAYRLRASFEAGTTDAERLARIEATLREYGLARGKRKKTGA